MIQLIEEADTVCLDADDTTANFFGAFLEYYNPLYGTSFVISDFWTRKFNLVLGCTIEEAHQRIDEFQHSLSFKKIQPIEGSVEAVNDLASRTKKLYISTSRADYTRDDTERFYDSFFRGKITDIFYSSNNHTGRANSGKTKFEICKDLKAPLIDDDISYLLPCAEVAFWGILFGNYSWQDKILPLDIPRIKSWSEI